MGSDNYSYIKLMLNDSLIEYTLKQRLIKIRYLNSLKNHKKIISKLDLYSQINAIINENVNFQVYTLIKEKINLKDKTAYEMMKEETERINALNESYKFGIVEQMSSEEMIAIIYNYTDDLWTRKKIKQIINKLNNSNNNKKQNKFKNKILQFPYNK